MHYEISGKHLDVGLSLKNHVKVELGSIIEKYAERPTNAVVVFSKSAHEYICDASVHLSTGLTVQAKAHSTEIYAAFDSCCQKMEKQLRRYKRRLKDHHRKRTEPVEKFVGSSYILTSDESVEENRSNSLQPIIIAEMQTQIPLLSVGEAVMQMELAGSSVLVFRNEAKNTINVVYQRDDGNIGWIDPGTQA